MKKDRGEGTKEPLVVGAQVSWAQIAFSMRRSRLQVSRLGSDRLLGNCTRMMYGPVGPLPCMVVRSVLVIMLVLL